jgi:hypothetical protein
VLHDRITKELQIGKTEEDNYSGITGGTITECLNGPEENHVKHQ